MIPRFFLFLLLVVLVSSPTAGIPARNPYPNELKGFKFYGRHLAPLRPFVSNRDSVLKVFGPEQEIKIDEWLLRPHYVGQGSTVAGHPWAQDIVGLLASITVKPNRRVTMLGVKFPAVFNHSLGGISEMNASCDVYTDSFGLQYWVVSEDSNVAKRGDLLQIVYGPSKRLEKKIIGS